MGLLLASMSSQNSPVKHGIKSGLNVDKYVSCPFYSFPCWFYIKAIVVRLSVV